MFNSISLLIFMFFGLCFGLVMYLYALNESRWLFAPESKLLAWFKAKRLFDVNEVEQPEILNSKAHDILYELGETLESPELSRFDKVKNDIFPKASEYYLKTQGMNVEVAPIPKRAELRLVK